MTITTELPKTSPNTEKLQHNIDKQTQQMQQQPCIDISIDRINKILQSLTPLTQPVTDKEGQTIQLWSSEKRPLFATVERCDGKIGIVSGRLITNPLSPSDTEKDIHQKLANSPLRRWDFTVDPVTKKINIWPHLIAAGRSDILPEGHIWFRQTPFKQMTAQQVDQRLRSKGFIPRGKDPVSGRGSYIHPKTGRMYRIDPKGSGKFPNEPSHVDVCRSKGENLPKKRLAYGNDPGSKTFKETLQQTKLTESYNSSHPKGQVPAKGSSSGQIGGIGNQVGMITGLFDSPDALHEDEHYFYFPAPEGKLPFTNEQLQQILRELATGIFIHDTVPFFSLHFNGDSNMFPVIHPSYQNTLVGRVISMLDYHMKGFLNGAFYDEEFITEWQDNPTQDESILREHVIDLHDYCQKNLGSDTHYFTVSEFIEIFEKKDKSLLSIGVGEDEPPIFKDYSGFRSSFRIIAKQNSVKKGGNVLSPDSDFDVLYTISPDPAYEEELRRYRMEHGTDPQSYQNLKKAYEAMAQQIKLIMPRLPLFHEYFEMLKVINFFCYYYRSMKEANKIPILESKSADMGSMSPFLFPFLPRRKSVSEQVSINLAEAINKLPKAQGERIHRYIRSMKSASPTIPEDIVEAVAKGYCEVVKDKYSYNLRDHYKSPEYYKEIARNDLADVIRQSTLLKSEASQQKNKVEKDLKEHKEALEKVRQGLVNRRAEKQLIDSEMTKIKQLFPHQTVTTTLINSQISDTQKIITDLEGKWFPSNIDKQNLEGAKHNLGVYQSLKVLWPKLTSAKPEVIKSIEALETAEKKLLEAIGSIEDCEQTIQDIDEDPVAKTIDFLECKLSIPGTVIQLFSEQSEQERHQNKRVVGGVGVSLSDQAVTLDPTGARALTSCFPEMHEADDGSFVPVKETDEVKGHLFKMGFVDYFTSDDSNYQLLEGSIEKVQQDLTPETVSVFYAIQDDDVDEFLELSKNAHINWNAKDPNGVSIMHYAASSRNPVFLKTLLAQKLSHDVIDTFGYNILHYAAREGHIDNVKLLLQKAPVLKNQKAKNGTTPLYLAVQNSRDDVVNELVRAGASVNDVTAYGMTPLYCAIFHSNEALALKLLDIGGIDVNKATEEGSTPLHLAIELGMTSVVGKLVGKGASLNVKRKDDFTPLHVAAQFGQLESIVIMKGKGGLNLNSPLKSGKTALHLAAQNFQHDVVIYLLGEGADPTKTGWDKETPLMVALKNGNTLSANAMIEGYGQAAVQEKERSVPLTLSADYYGNSPMDIAIENSLLSVIEQLLLTGETLTKEQVMRCCEKIDDSIMIGKWIESIDFVPGTKSAFIEDALQAAATHGKNKVVSMLMRKYKAVGSFTDNKGRGLIHYAAAHDHFTIIKNAIKKYPQSLFVKDRNGETAATLAARRGSLRVLKQILLYLSKENKPQEIAQLLGAAVLGGCHKSAEAILRKMKDPNVPLDKAKRTAMHYAVIDGDVQMVAFLKERGCRFDVRDDEGKTPFHYAVEHGWEEVLDYLFDKKNELSIPMDLLYHAAAKGKSDIIKRLVEEQGFSVNASKSLTGDPAIFGAIREGNFETFATLASYGIDPNAMSKDKTTALYLAARSGKHQFVSFLANNGASLEVKVKGRTPLHIAAAYGHLECIQELLLAGADPKNIDGKGNTAKKLAETYKHHDVVHVLSDRTKEFEAKKTCVLDAIRNGDTNQVMNLLRTAPLLPLNKSLSVKVEGRTINAPILHLIYLFAKHEKKDGMFQAFVNKKGVKIDVTTPNGDTIAHLMAQGGECDPAFKDLWVVKDEKGKTPLHYMARYGSEKELLKMLQSGGFAEHIDGTDEQGATPLIDAIAGNRSGNVKILLRAGANPNHLTKMKVSPLALAAMEERTMIVKALLEAGAHVDRRCLSTRTTALKIAIRKGEKETVQLLLSHGASATISDTSGVSPVMVAAAKGDLKLLRLLHVRGASLYDTDHRGRNVAHYAAQSHCVEMIDYLRRNGVSFQERSVQRKAPVVEPKVKPPQGVLPFHLASGNGDIAMMQKLDSIGSNIEAVDDSDDSALLYATLSGNDGCVKFFESYRLMKDRTQVSKSVVTAVGKDNVPQLEFLVNDDFALDAPLDPTGMTAVHFAAMYGGVHSLLYLIQQGADITVKTTDGHTPFDLAVKHGKVQVAKLLARFDDVEVNAETPDGSTHLHQACASGDIRMVGFLLKYDANVNTFDEHGHTALYVAAEKGQVKLVSLLLAAGADASKVSTKGQSLLELVPLHEKSYRMDLGKQLKAIAQSAVLGDTRLHRALRMGDELSIKFFSNIDDLDKKNEQGDTALHLAVKLANERAIRNLVREGAKLDAKDARGRTPLMVAATELYDMKMVEFLLSLGADHSVEDNESTTIMHALVQQKPTNKNRRIFNYFYRMIPPNPPTVIEAEMVELIKNGNIPELFGSIHKGYRSKVKNDTWLHHAVKHGQPELGCLLIDWFPRLLNIIDDENAHVLDLAAASGSSEVTAMLLSKLSTETGEYIIKSSLNGNSGLFDDLHQVVTDEAESIKKYSNDSKVNMLKTWFESAKSRLDMLDTWKAIIERYPHLEHPSLDVQDREALYKVTKGFKAWLKKHKAAVTKIEGVNLSKYLAA